MPLCDCYEKTKKHPEKVFPVTHNSQVFVTPILPQLQSLSIERRANLLCAAPSSSPTSVLSMLLTSSSSSLSSSSAMSEWSEKPDATEALSATDSELYPVKSSMRNGLPSTSQATLPWKWPVARNARSPIVLGCCSQWSDKNTNVKILWNRSPETY